MNDEKIMDDYIRECWNQDPDTWTPEEKAAVKKTIDFSSYQLQKIMEKATSELIEKLDKYLSAWNRLGKRWSQKDNHIHKGERR